MMMLVLEMLIKTQKVLKQIKIFIIFRNFFIPELEITFNTQHALFSIVNHKADVQAVLRQSNHKLREQILSAILVCTE